MNTIWKFEVPVSDLVTVEMPKSARLLTVGTQRPRHLCFWALVDPKEKAAPRTFAVRGTGHPIKPGEVGTFWGTVFDGPFVWHVFLVG